MTCLDIRRAMFKAATDGDANLALQVCSLVKTHNLFIGEPAKPTGHELFIPISEYPGRCGECGQQIPTGEPIYWGKGVGQWHEQCYEGAKQ